MNKLVSLRILGKSLSMLLDALIYDIDNLGPINKALKKPGACRVNTFYEWRNYTTSQPAG